MPSRRQIILGLLSVTGLASLAGWWRMRTTASGVVPSSEESQVIKRSFALDFQWPTQEPFLFCVHHNDLYPKGTAGFGPEASLLTGRDMGQDFAGKDGFRMYHGQEVPGFPVHPHRGFETITIVRRGYVDHADSLGAAGRYGEGDVQWMTAGAGVQHSEMFPLLHRERDNTMELFQIWLNLPKRSKMVPAHFKMLWSEEIPRLTQDDGRVSISLIAGSLADQKALAPPPDSWAADPANEVSILLVKMAKGGVFRMPASQAGANRTLYYFAGDQLALNGISAPAHTGFNLDSSQELELRAGADGVEFLIMQARPIGEPMFQHGPFVMNTREDIIQTIEDYRRTEFGGWSWPRADMVHGPTIERFAKYPDGRIEKPKKA